MRSILFATSLLALASGTGSSVPPLPISNAPPLQQVNTALQNTQAGQDIDQGFLNAEFNLDSAVEIGVLQQGDAADTCIHQVNTQLGIEPTPAGGTPPPPAQQFTPKITDMISGGSVLYILTQEALAAKASGGIQVPVSCEALVGQLVIQAGAVGVQAISTSPIAMSRAPKKQ